jgi:hypothetical protein
MDMDPEQNAGLDGFCWIADRPSSIRTTSGASGLDLGSFCTHKSPICTQASASVLAYCPPSDAFTISATDPPRLHFSQTCSRNRKMV